MSTRGSDAPEPEGDYTDVDEQDGPTPEPTEPAGSYVDKDETSLGGGTSGGYADRDGESATGGGREGSYVDTDD